MTTTMENENKHTPGPWRISFTADTNGLRVVQDSNRPRLIADIHDTEAAGANAKLISAAPEMADALRAALAFFDGSISFDHAVGRDARAALQKAGRLP